MKQLLQQYAAYNAWANKKILDNASGLSEAQLNAEIVSSFPSIYKTVAHLWEVESVWWQRIKLTEHVIWPSASFTGDFAELGKNLLQTSAQWDQWVKDTTEAGLQHVFLYQNSKKEQFKQPIYEMLVHLFNHQSFHRGQIVTMFRQLGMEKITGMDFVLFCRRK